ncbi:MAG TPA: hypothetical protein VL527_01310 [Dongiaceae bacterium]|nr:hypothetical protein [Dongiaceae bacterium]
MKKWIKRILGVALVFLGLFVGWVAFGMFAKDHGGQLPFSTNGFGEALLLLAKDYSAYIQNVCGPDDDGHLYWAALTNHTVLPENQCTRVYIQGLSEENDPQICILFDRDSHKGGDHQRSPWGHPLREVCLVDGSMRIIPDETWPEFSRKQVDLLVAAGFARTNALGYYPAARE